MYRALEQMKVRGPLGTAIVLQPGEVIADFDDWSPWTQRVMLDEKRVRWAPEGLSDHEKHRAAREAVRAGFHGRPGHEAIVGVSSVAADELQQNAVEAEPGLVRTDGALLPDAQNIGTEPVDPLQCGVCSRSGFKDAAGLKIHMARAHKGA